MPPWLQGAINWLTRGWYDPAEAQAKVERTDAAVDAADRIVTRADKAVEAYRRESLTLGRK